MPKQEATDGRSDAHEDSRHTDTSAQRRAVSPALAVPRPASVSFRTSSVAQVLAGRRAHDYTSLGFPDPHALR